MKRYALCLFLGVLASCAPPPKQKPVAQASARPSDLGQAMASNQSIPCTFEAEVLSVARIKGSPKQYIVDPEPKWEVKLTVLSSGFKVPFGKGSSRCSVADVQATFGAPPEEISGVYRFTYIWNIDVPGKPQFENFRARRK